MRWEVTAQLTGDDGTAVIWGYSRTEVHVATAEGEAAIVEEMARVGVKVLDAIDEAKESIGAQIAASNDAFRG